MKVDIKRDQKDILEDLKRDDRAEVHHEHPLMFTSGIYRILKKHLAVYCADCHAFVTKVEQGTRINGMGTTLLRDQVQKIHGLWKDANSNNSEENLKKRKNID